MLEEISEPAKEDCESKQHPVDSENKDLQFIHKETKLVQDDTPAETFVAEKIVPAEEISDEKEDIEMQRLLRILLCFSYFGLLKMNTEHGLMEMNFRKQKEVFVNGYIVKKNSFCFLKFISIISLYALNYNNPKQERQSIILSNICTLQVFYQSFICSH